MLDCGSAPEKVKTSVFCRHRVDELLRTVGELTSRVTSEQETVSGTPQEGWEGLVYTPSMMVGDSVA